MGKKQEQKKGQRNMMKLKVTYRNSANALVREE